MILGGIEWCRSGDFIVNTEHISHLVSIGKFEHSIASWGNKKAKIIDNITTFEVLKILTTFKIARILNLIRHLGDLWLI